MNIGDIASGIYYTDFDDTGTAPTLTSISGWLSAHVGDLNSLIYMSYDPTGDFPQEESNIFSALYLCQYYSRQSVSTLKGIGITSADWTSLKEGDTTINRTSRNEIAKTFLSLSKDQRDLLNDLVSRYNIYMSAPRQVAGEDQFYPRPRNWNIAGVNPRDF